MNQKRIEQRGLWLGILINTIMAVSGITVFLITDIEALFVDAYFTVITLVSGMVSIIISKVSSKKSQRFPDGLFVLEPIFSLCQSLLTIVLLSLSVVTVSVKAYRYFAFGEGQMMNVGPVLPYEMVMVCLSFTLSWFYSRQNKKINNSSTMLLTETKGTLIDGIMSSGIGVAALLIFLIPVHSPLHFLLYTGDFFVTITLIAFTIKMPFQVIKLAFIEISGGVLQNEQVQQKVEHIVRTNLADDILVKSCVIYKTGMAYRVKVLINGTVNGDINLKGLAQQKQKIVTALRHKFAFMNLDLVYDA
ncbi:cation transporter [Leuconostoc pseudomesenteroides]|uniref:cation transporter n=1 Tax=Leuconostoc pseudomesenteroides TaxID=33968 RepID=UPI0040372208